MYTQIWQLLIVAVITLLQSNLIEAQPRKGEFIEASTGIALSAPD